MGTSEPALTKDRVFRRRIALGLIVLSLSWLGWEIGTTAIADFNVGARPEVALSWAPDHPGALINIAEEKLTVEPTDIDWSEVEELGRAALVSAPLSSAPLRILGLVAEGQGDLRRAEMLVEMSAARALRDPRTLTWLADQRLLAGDVRGGLTAIDALLRVWPEAETGVFPVLSEMLKSPEAANVLMAKLEEDTPWRTQFLRGLPTNNVEPKVMVRVLQQLLEGETPPSPDELRPSMEWLVGEGEIALAHSLWAKFRGDADQIGLVKPTNGNFEEPISGLPFDWSLKKGRGATADIRLENGSKALHVAFHNTRVSQTLVAQALILTPGSYILSGMMRLHALDNERGVQWVISCLGAPGDGLGETERVNGTIPWTNFQTRFEVPDTTCTAQALELQLAARAAAEQHASGDVWFDELRIEKADAASELD